MDRGDDPEAYDEVFDLEAGGNGDDAEDMKPLIEFLDFLNNSDDATGVADQVVIVESDGVPVERVSYSAQGIAAGRTLEREGNTWRPSASAGGTGQADGKPAAIDDSTVKKGLGLK